MEYVAKLALRVHRPVNLDVNMCRVVVHRVTMLGSVMHCGVMLLRCMVCMLRQLDA
jgi:hypothetical protein